MSGAAGMSASARKELTKKLRKFPRELTKLAKKMPISSRHPLSHLDGIVAALHPTLDFFICSPNMDCRIPLPRLGNSAVLTICDDYWFGAMDFVLWPQMWSATFPHFPCIPRIQRDGPLRGLWLSPLLDHDFVVDVTVGQGLGRLRDDLLAQIIQAAESTKAEAARVLDVKKVRLASSLALAVDHFMHILRTRALTFRRTLLSLRCLQRASLELQGLNNYYRYVVNHWNVTSGTRPVERSWLGAFSNNPKNMALLFHAGVPLWSVWYITDSVRTRCFAVVSVEMPEETLVLAEAREPNMRKIIYEGVNENDQVYRGLQRWLTNRIGALLPHVMISVLPQRPSGALPAPSTLSRPTRTGKQEKKHAGKVRTFKQAYHKYLPTPVHSWIRALETIEDNDQQCIDPKAHLVFSLPRPELFVSAATNDKLAILFANWLRLRVAVYSLVRNPEDMAAIMTSRMSHQAWRLLVHSGTLDITMPKEGAKETRFADEVAGFVQAIRHDEPGIGGVPLSLTPSWQGEPFRWNLEDVRHDAFCREVVWEVAYLGFVLDLLLLDACLHSWQSADDHDAATIQILRLSNDFGPLEVDLGMANTGLAEVDWFNRAPFIYALKIVVAHWNMQAPHEDIPLCIKSTSQSDYTKEDMDRLEAALARVVIQAFYVQFRRPPVLPPTLPQPGADPAHVRFQPPPIEQAHARPGFWRPTPLLRELALKN